MAQLKDLYLMIAGNEEERKELAMNEGKKACCVVQTGLGQCKNFYSEFNKKPMQLMQSTLRSMLVVRHTRLHDLKRLGSTADFSV